MERIAILTDSNSGISKENISEHELLGISSKDLKDVFIVPMPFYINGDMHYENVDITQDEFYKRIDEPDTKITTSMPAIGDLMDRWDELLKSYDKILYIPMSSGLSSSCQTAIALAEDYDGKVLVADNHRVSVTQKLSVYQAIKLLEKGKSAKEIKDFLEKTKYESSTYITVATLEYLKRGGRLTPAVAMLGNILKIKPVLQYQGGKLDTCAVARTMKQAKKKMMAVINKDLNEKFFDSSAKDCVISISHTNAISEAEIFKNEILEEFPNQNIIIDPLPLSVACHIGPGSLAVTASSRHNL